MPTDRYVKKSTLIKHLLVHNTICNLVNYILFIDRNDITFPHKPLPLYIFFVSAKDKIYAIKRTRNKTGGGPPPLPLTDVDLLMTQSMGGRPGIHGLEIGFDTDGK